MKRRDHLAANMVVWIAHVSQAQDSLVHLEPCLDDHDRERAARFHFADDRARFILGRGLLRKCLGHYLEQKPETIELAYTDLGRPILPHDKDVHFNISHTQDLVAIALTSGARIGIDLEYAQPHSDLIELAGRIFSADDLKLFQALPSREKTDAFYRAWTRKEAYLKARGEGIAEGLQLISVSFGSEETVSIIDSRDEAATSTWRLRALPLPGGYTGNLACDDMYRHLELAFVELEQGELTIRTSSYFI